MSVVSQAIIGQARAVPRAMVGAGLGLARVPVAAAARATGQRDNIAWAPGLVFEGLEANVETLVGSLLRDDTLVSRGRLRQAKVAKLRRAGQLEVVADTHREQAGHTLAQRREQAERQREQARKTATRREQAIEGQAQQQERQVERQAATKAAAAGAVKQAQDQLAERQAREAKAEVLDREAEALAAEKQALDAADTVATIDETIEGTKAARES